MLKRQVDTSAQVAMLKVAARNYRMMNELYADGLESYTEWRVMHEIRCLLVDTLGYMTFNQFNEAMRLLAAEYKKLEEEVA